ncbi:CAP domain-containing protein [Variovorax sp. YR216]|uniref:CAP domain-containing protein n=1 Tax=Variovorax sp. YR216 TaxID=1882828 RepID=UPI000899E60F|nr:CAP domain-containing protein [Variovorax sp. YR216]SEB26337.1 Uncharacterized conserved protein YkwD, contains CAP (CSP/antigen 5/PR1) domain [Variovorax sp. YR216]
MIRNHKAGAFEKALTAAFGTMVAFALTACGGGGGGGTGGYPAAMSTTTSTPSSTATGSSTGTQQTAAEPGSEELAAFELLNDERLKCGFGPLVRNSALDAAARGHANWLLLNNRNGHYQTERTQGFTGVNVLDRASTAGYSAGWVEDENASFARSSATGVGQLSIRTLLSGPYHMRGLVDGYRDVGLAVMTSEEAGATNQAKRVVAQVDIGYTGKDGRRSSSPGVVSTYPCDGTNGTFAQSTSESPNPVPGRTSPTGQPIFVFGDYGKSLTISSALLQEVITGNTPTLLPTMSATTDPNGYLWAHEAAILPDQPLKTSTAYRVTIVGINAGKPFTKTFTFTTGAFANAASAPN